MPQTARPTYLPALSRGGPAREPGQFWAFLLSLIILGITLGPRLRLGAVGGKNLDLRLQDPLLVLAIMLLGLSPTRRSRMKAVWGVWGSLYGFLAIITTIVFLQVHPEVPFARPIVFAGRSIELLILATTVATLYRAAGDRAMRAALRAIHIAAVLNIGWVAYQYATGTRQVLVGAAVGDQIESYGPKLVGEPSSFGTGFFFAFIAAVGAAEFVTRDRKRAWALFLIAAGAAGAYASQSRISMAGALLTAAVILIAPRMRRINPAGVTFLVLLAALAVLLVPSGLQGRLSPAGAQAGLDVRINYIWRPLSNYALERPLLGIGPGSLGTPLYPWTEAHNILLRTALDFGIPTAICFALLLGTGLVRSWHAAQNTDALELRVFATIAFCTVAVVVTAGMVQESLSAVTSSHITMLTVGLFGGAVSRVRQRDQEPPDA